MTFCTVGELIGLLRQVDDRLPVVLRLPPEASEIAVEASVASYLPADAIVARGACLVIGAASGGW